MTTFPVTTRLRESTEKPTYSEDDIESELFFSTREAGVTCLPVPGDGFEEDDD